MTIRKFNFPSFEEWKKTEDYKQKIGAYTCAIRIFSFGLENAANQYVAAISANENPINIYAERSIEHYLESSDEKTLRSWYEKVISNLNKEWENFLLKTYFDN